MQTHYGDPCIHCATPHDNVPVGPCRGDPSKAVPIAYCSLGVRWDKVEHLRVRMSDGRVEDIWEHIDLMMHWKLGRYDETLKRKHGGAR